MDSISELHAHFKRTGADIASLTHEQVAEVYTGNDSASLITAMIRRKEDYQQNPPKRRKRPRRQPRKDTGRRKPRSASAVFQSQRQAGAMVEQLDRVNEVKDNPLRLINTQPGQPFPTFVVVHLGDDPDWLTANLPDTGYEQIDHGGLVAGIDY